MIKLMQLIETDAPFTANIYGGCIQRCYKWMTPFVQVFLNLSSKTVHHYTKISLAKSLVKSMMQLTALL